MSPGGWQIVDLQHPRAVKFGHRVLHAKFLEDGGCVGTRLVFFGQINRISLDSTLPSYPADARMSEIAET